MRISFLIPTLIFFISAISANGAQREITLFNDGALVEIETTGKKGLFELQLPGQIREATLRVKPLDAGEIIQVKILQARIPEKLQKELDSLQEQKSRLDDRMKALQTRESIFAAAAKSQSSKAPRKSKTNPDPMTSVRQGTDFAIAQLESVYTARRRTENDLKKIEQRKAQLLKGVATGPTAKITATQGTNRIKVAVILADGGWKPFYELRINRESHAVLSLMAETTPVPDGYSAMVVPATLEKADNIRPLPLPHGSAPRLAEWKVTLDKVNVKTMPLPLFSFTLSNSTKTVLPAGEASIFSNGEYIGKASIPAMQPEAIATISNQQAK